MEEEAQNKILREIRATAERKYPRRLAVLARRCGWSHKKTWRVLNDRQALKLAEAIIICGALGVPLSAMLQQAGT